MKELANFEENFKLSEAAFTISNMSVGISRMTLKKLGTIEVNPRVCQKSELKTKTFILGITRSWNSQGTGSGTAKNIGSQSKME